jgi:general stress protein 26
MEWFILIRMRGIFPAFVSAYGTQQAMEDRAKVAERWGDKVEQLGPRMKR